MKVHSDLQSIRTKVTLNTPAESEIGSIERYETSTSGGKAHAIDLYPKDPSLLHSSSTEGAGAPVWVLLTDDSDYAAGEAREGEASSPNPSSSKPIGAVRVLEWDGWGTGGPREVVGWPSEEGEPVGEENGKNSEELMRGGSHAVWLEGVWDLD